MKSTAAVQKPDSRRAVLFLDTIDKTALVNHTVFNSY